MYLLGFDIGSSSIKVSLINAESGAIAASAFHPKQEMQITAQQSGWAEQDPEMWWKYLAQATKEVIDEAQVDSENIKAIGISYQMHGLVLLDKNKNVLRPSIIWCDSRAVEIGNKAFKEIGQEKCLENLLNSPGNFTASKLKWVKDNEPKLYAQIDKIMLPGDYIAMKLTGEINTTASGMSEGIMYDFKNNKIADFLLDYFGFEKDFIPEIKSSFAVHGTLTAHAANELNLKPGIKVAYRAGDQPNNALSLNVLKPGEIAATAGTSGVVYGVSNEVKYDPESRVNTFAHVNHTPNDPHLGVLLCVNGTGILNSWLKKNIGQGKLGYPEMNEQAASIKPGAEGLIVLPFGNGAERMLQNKNIGCQISGLNFNIHKNAHLFRAAQEGIVFSFKYGIDIMQSIGISPTVIRAGNANMFLSPIFRETLANITQAEIELYDTDGAKGAALGAGVGAGFYNSFEEAFSHLKKITVIQPKKELVNQYEAAYQNWKKELTKNFL